MFPVRFHCICVILRLSATLVHNVEDSYISKNNTHSPYATEEKAMGYLQLCICYLTLNCLQKNIQIRIIYSRKIQEIVLGQPL